MVKYLKRTVSILLCILMVAGLFTAVPFTAGAAVDSDCLEYGYFYYRVLDNGNAQIAGFNTEAAQEDEEYDIVIPDTIDGHTVTGIEAEAFSYAYLDSLTIPYTVTDISLYAFDAYSISEIQGYNGTAAETFCEQWASLFGFTFVSLGDASHTHTYGAPVWTWADDFSSATARTATIRRP